MASPSSDYGNGLATTAQNTGQSALNSFDPTSTANGQRTGFTSTFGAQMGTSGPTNTNDFINTYKGAANANNMEDLYTRANDTYNVPTLQKNAAYLNNQVAYQPEIQTDRARGFDFSQGQVDNATNQALMRLSPMASMATTQAQNAQGLAAGMVNAGQTEKGFELQPYQTQGQMLNDAMARESSGFNIAAQNELQGLIAKMQSGVALSQAEYERANVLAQQETSYQNTITTANAQIKSTQIGQQNTIIPYGGSYLNANTGQHYTPK